MAITTAMTTTRVGIEHVVVKSFIIVLVGLVVIAIIFAIGRVRV